MSFFSDIKNDKSVASVILDNEGATHLRNNGAPKMVTFWISKNHVFFFFETQNFINPI